MTTKSTKSLTYIFEKPQFPSLMCQEFETGEWHEVGVSYLSPEEQAGLIDLVTEAGLINNPNYDPEKLLLVKAADGILVEVYGPCFFSNDNNIILKVGSTQSTVIQKGDRITVGILSGKISCQTKTRLDGSEYPICTVNLMSPDKVFYRVRVALKDASMADIEACLLGEEENSLLPYLAPVPSGALKMYQLGIGEWSVKAISASEGQFGISYKLHLASGQVVYATGNSQKILENPSFKFDPNIPITLKISSIEEIADGKYRVHNALLRRLPKLAGSPKSAEVKTLNAQYSVSLPTQEFQSESQSDCLDFDPEPESIDLVDLAF